MSRDRTVILLLPAWSVFGRQALSPELATAFARADASPAGEAGIQAQLSRVFSIRPARWAPAALTRQAEVGDAVGSAWLRADPAHVRPDINGARLLGIGERLGLDDADAEALLPALKPVFGDAGFELDAPSPTHWYLRLPREAKLPAFSAPDDAIGADLFEHQPEGPEGRRWRALINETQIVLHNHPWNARRAERGLVPVNSLWLWGGGVLPTAVRGDVTRCASDDDLACALTRLAGGDAGRLPASFTDASMTDGTALFDLRRVRDLAALQRDWLLPLLRAVGEGRCTNAIVDTADGGRFVLRRSQRWRVWRKRWSMPAATDAN
jgi:hypothetical protein